MKRPTIILFLALSLLLLPLGCSQYSKVQMKSGRMVSARILSSTSTHVLVKTAEGNTEELERIDIASVSFVGTAPMAGGGAAFLVGGLLILLAATVGAESSDKNEEERADCRSNGGGSSDCRKVNNGRGGEIAGYIFGGAGMIGGVALTISGLIRYNKEKTAFGTATKIAPPSGPAAPPIRGLSILVEF